MNDSIADAGMRARYVDVPDIIASWVEPKLKLAEADVLDFGCGEGISALGMLRRKQVRSLMGVDIMPDVHNCLARGREHLGLQELPANMTLEQIAPGADFAPGRQFDLVYSWSVFEHVEQPRVADVLALLKSKIRDGGYLFIQIAPLYYSAEGSHLFHRIPEPWGHLRDQESIHYKKLCEACSSKEEIDALWSCYQWLNRITAPALRRAIQAAGFRIEREILIADGPKAPDDLAEVYHREILETNQVVFLAKKPGTPA